MRVQMTVMLTRMSYAPLTVCPAWPSRMHRTMVPASDSSAMCGVRHFGWTRPKLSGRT